MLYPAKEFIFVSIFFINSVKTADICYKSDWNNYIVGKKLSEFPIKIFDKIGPQSCYRECQAHGNCFSANYDKKESTCQLMNTKKSEMKLLTDDENFIHIELTDTDSAGGKTCGDVVCNNYSTCIRTSSRQICIETVNGGWGTWYGWGSCSTTCGCGTKQRTRYCDNPVPSYGGSSCSGSSVESTTCNTNGCPVHGGWGNWNGWGSCSPWCGSGTKKRTRYCNNPAPLYGGNSCSGSSVEHTTCNNYNGCRGYISLDTSDIPYTGLLYVYIDGTWGTVCDDDFGVNEAHVACKTLGFARATALHGTSTLGVGSGPILMDDVRCSGNEESLFHCNYTSYHNCYHSEDVGITCEN
ncbi:thrombospondin-1-like isoform X2 [Crassostrea virginica]